MTELHLTDLLVLHWFDGPLEALALSRSGESYLVQHVGQSPITSASVYRVLRQRRGTFEEIHDACVASMGHQGSHVHVLPPIGTDGTVDRTLELLGEGGADDGWREGYCLTADLLGSRLSVAWLTRQEAEKLVGLEGAALWLAVTAAVDGEDRSAE